MSWCNNCFCDPCSCNCRNCPEFCTSLTITNSWNIPACAGEAVLYIPGLTSVIMGTFLYIPPYGYYEITGFNSINSQVTVRNNCYGENAAPGTLVPANAKAILSAVAGNTSGVTSSWTPTLTASGSMTVSATSIKEAVYYAIGNHIHFRFGVSFTLGGTQDVNVYIPLPTPAVTYAPATNYICTAWQNGAPVNNEGIWTIDATPRIIVGTANGSSWTLGAGARIMIQGWYDKA